jgi:hypothetical protein
MTIKKYVLECFDKQNRVCIFVVNLKPNVTNERVGNLVDNIQLLCLKKAQDVIFLVFSHAIMILIPTKQRAQ